MTTVLDVQRFKDEGRHFAMLTAYDFLSARILDEAGIPILLVGDSLGMVMLGHPTTLPVTLEDMLHHAKAVARGARQALLIGDMPFMSYQASIEQAITSAGRFMQEAGMHGVKLEGGGRVIEITRRLTEVGIPVMGHVGLTPQFVHQMGGFKVQGRTEGVPSKLAAEITGALRIPTIGIGAGPATDGQVLVLHDMLGLTTGKAPKFVKRYANLAEDVARAATEYAEDVRTGRFPGPEHEYSANGAAPASQGHKDREEIRYGG